ncbi:membrane protein [Mycobacteroides abscessus subsp. abscessus]|nr:membrane protein [Mycobacteroides abscessus subsp. abscessus]
MFTVVLRALLFVIVLFITTKLLGKKHISQLSLFEYIAGITLGDIAGEVILNSSLSVMHGILGIFVFAIISYLADVISLQSKTLRNVIEGTGTVLVEDGKLLEENLKKEHYTIDDFSTLLRQKDVFSLSEIEYAVLEPKGMLSVLLKKENRPITPKDLNIKVPSEKAPQTIIMDGNIVYESLTKAGKTPAWLHMELEKLGVTLDNVFLGQVDSYGELTIDIFDDKIKLAEAQERPLLLATIKKVQADLEMYSLQTGNKDAKIMYRKNADKMEQVKNTVKMYLGENF